MGEGDAPPRAWKHLERVRLTLGDEVAGGCVLLASPNGRSLVVEVEEGFFAGYVGAVPLLYERGAFRDLLKLRAIGVEPLPNSE